MCSRLNEKHSVRLSIRHPSIASEVITEAMGVRPTHAWTMGAPKVTPTGRPLSGIYPDTRWNYVLNSGNGDNLSEFLEKIIALIKEKTAFLKEIRAESGSVGVTVSLHGKVHSGNVITYTILEALAVAQVDLGIEVFPNWN